MMTKISVRSASGRYPVVCARGALNRTGALVRSLPDVSGVFVLSSPIVWRHCGKALERGLRGIPEWRRILFNDAESAKTPATVAALCRKLARAGADRKCVIVALGGGVVGDVAGFVAATYLRSVRLVHVPTTLVAQIDSSIGGKTGVDIPEGKNLVGAFYPPEMVISDPNAVATLPERQYRSGLYEVIKTGVIGDRILFEYLEKNLAALLRRERHALEWIILRCIRFKANVVAKDERESGLRQILNFGHTTGHALEAATKYRTFAHGEAVAWGMMVATLLSTATDRMSAGEAMRIIILTRCVGALPSTKGIPVAKLLRIMRGDKKSRDGHVRWVLPRSIGGASWGIAIPDSLAAEAIRRLPKLGGREGRKG